MPKYWKEIDGGTARRCWVVDWMSFERVIWIRPASTGMTWSWKDFSPCRSRLITYALVH